LVLDVYLARYNNGFIRAVGPNQLSHVSNGSQLNLDYSTAWGDCHGDAVILPRLLIINRGDGQNRRILNIDNLVSYDENPELHEMFCVAVVNLEKLILPVQAALFRRADVVLAAHGAALGWTLGSMRRSKS
jgi:hypothetical protein